MERTTAEFFDKLASIKQTVDQSQAPQQLQHPRPINIAHSQSHPNSPPRSRREDLQIFHKRAAQGAWQQD